MKDSDRYFTGSIELQLVLAQWGSIDLDPCWDPESIVQADKVYDIRQGEDGLILPWSGRVWLNPPYSSVEPWLQRAAQHASTGGEVLAMVPASTGTSYWRRLVFPWSSICCLSPRPLFTRPSSLGPLRSAAPKDLAVLYYGPNRDNFARVWAPRGEIVQALRLSRKT